MFRGKKNNPLLSMKVIHAIEGRVRVGCHGLTYLQEVSGDIRDRLLALRGIEAVAISNITGNLLIHYNHTDVDLDQILETAETVISSYAYYAHNEKQKAEAAATAHERGVDDESVPAMIRNIALIAVALAVSGVRKRIGWGKAVQPGSRLGAAPLMALGMGLPIFQSGAKSVVASKRPNADTLTSAAILTSVFTGQSLSALTIILLHDIAELLTAYTLKRTKGAIREMLSNEDDMAWRQLPDGTMEQIRVEDACRGDRIRAHTGEKIGVDGVVMAGDALVDQSAITGEFLPAKKERGAVVFAGTTVKDGTVTFQATKVGKDTAVKNIIRMVENATENKAAVQNFADRFSSSLLFLNLFLFVFVYAVTRNMSRALNMLVIDYSCGLRLSTSAALCASVNTAARNGVFIKGSNHIEALSESDTLILDKTGTVTKGKPQVVSIFTLNEHVNKAQLVSLAAAAEETSRHPMARAILSKAKSQGWRVPPHGEIKIVAGKGVETVVGPSVVRVGNKKFMAQHGLLTHPFRQRASGMALAGESIVYVSKDDSVIGIMGISDPLRDNMKKSINRLRMSGIDDIVLLTGDLEQHAEVVANRMSMDRYESEMMPEDKAKAVLQIQSQGSRVVMVGDGINDAAALAYADVGIALGQTRTDIAMESADIIVSSDNPMMLPALFRLSDSTMKVIRQNFAAAIGINSIGLVLGGIGVLPVFWGAVLHNSSTILVVANSLRLLTHEM
jgi:cation-transporting P-type ATPase C